MPPKEPTVPTPVKPIPPVTQVTSATTTSNVIEHEYNKTALILLLALGGAALMMFRH